MPETLTMPDGTVIDIDAAEADFHAAQNAPEPGDVPDYPAPPKRDPAAPRAARPRKGADDKARTARSVPAAPRKGGAKVAPKDRKAGVDGVLQLTAGVLVAFPATRADAAAVGMHAEPLSAAVVATAEQDDRFARALDKLLTTGPYAALVMAVVPLAVQIAANHRLVPAGFMGTEDPAELRAQVDKSLAGQMQPAEAAA